MAERLVDVLDDEWVEVESRVVLDPFGDDISSFCYAVWTARYAGIRMEEEVLDALLAVLVRADLGYAVRRLVALVAEKALE